MPYYFNHEMAVVMAGGRAGAGADGAPTISSISTPSPRAITPRTRAVVTVSPNNPTGAVYDEASLRAVNALCRDRGLFHIHDETYEYFTYGGASHFSPGSIAGAAGAHGLALLAVEGLRHGGLARGLHGGAGRAVRARSTRFRTRCSSAPPAVSQRAAIAALDRRARPTPPTGWPA